MSNRFPSIDLRLQPTGDGEMRDLADRMIVPEMSSVIRLVVLSGGMSSGLPSVCLAIELPDGRIVLAETSARLFCVAAQAVRARYPEIDAN